MLTAIIFVAILGLLIFVHELGHFLVARRNGVKVEEFGFGFPPRIFGVKRGETVYSINWIPLGGFVKIFGEDGGDKRDARSFGHKKIWQRAAILLAGVAMNFFLAIILLSIGFGVGLPAAIDDDVNAPAALVQIAQVSANSPAAAAGLRDGDAIIGLRSSGSEVSQITKVAQVQNFTEENKGETVTVTIKRGKQILSFNIIPCLDPPKNEGAMGVALARITKISYPWYQAIYEGVITAANLVKMTAVAFGSLFWRLISGSHISGGEVVGPVGIYSITGMAAQMGWIYLLQLTALLSLNLAIINILPFPALDGGRILFLVIEKIKGRPISETVERAIHSAGFVFLILLMIFITVRDVVKIL